MTEEKPYTTGEFCWNECGTRDPAAVKAFYAEIFGWGMKDVAMPGPEGGTYTLLQVEGKDVGGLYEMKGPQFEKVPPHWLSYIHAEDVDATVKTSESLGGRTMAEPFDVPGVGRMAMVMDPTGAMFSIFHPGEHGGAARMGDKHGGFCWNELMTTDTDKAGAYYTRLFPWTSDTMAGSSGPYTVFKKGDTMAAGMMQITREMGPVPPHWLAYVTVTDCDATVAKATSLGGKVLMPGMDIPDLGRFAVLQDPSGAVFAVFQSKQG